MADYKKKKYNEDEFELPSLDSGKTKRKTDEDDDFELSILLDTKKDADSDQCH